MNKLRLFLVLITVIGPISVNAQLFWQISGNGLEKPSFLFGTHHVIDKDSIHNFQAILEFCGMADAVVGEIDMNDPSMQAKIMQGATLTEGSLKDLMSPEEYALIDTEFKQLMGYGLEPFNKMKPMMLISVYTMMSYMKAMNMTRQPEGVDLLFQKKAKEMGHKVLALETTEEQIELLFNAIPVQRQIELFVKGIKEKDKNIEQIKKLDSAYMSEDLARIEAIGDGEDWTPEERALMVDKRNLNWFDKLPALMAEQSCFIAVGCLHLIGETGLINQLKKAGYTVSPGISFIYAFSVVVHAASFAVPFASAPDVQQTLTF